MISFSIVMPNYNSARFIEESINSVPKGDTGNLELIVVDGLSTDGSIDILHSLKSQISQLIIEKDSGQANAINKGLKLAKGEWVAFLNSDDIYYPKTISDVSNIIEEQPNLKWIVGKSRKFGNSGEFFEHGLLKVPKNGNAIDWVTYDAFAPQQASFIHRSVFEDIGFFDESFHYAFDCEFWLRMYLNGYRPVEIDAELAGFRIHTESKTGTSRLPFLDEHRKMMMKHADHFSKFEMKQAEKILDQLTATSKIYEIDKWIEVNPFSELFNNLQLYPGLLKERFFWGAVKKVLLS